MTSFDPDGGSINDVCIFPDSGLMLLALDNSQIPSYFIPALGPAPKWCSHLDNLTVSEFLRIGFVASLVNFCLNNSFYRFLKTGGDGRETRKHII